MSYFYLKLIFVILLSGNWLAPILVRTSSSSSSSSSTPNNYRMTCTCDTPDETGF